jgi:hypothetical protein
MLALPGCPVLHRQATLQGIDYIQYPIYMTISSRAQVLVAADKPGVRLAEKRKAPFLKVKKKDSGKNTVSAVTEEMSKPRVAKSARTLKPSEK